MWKIKNRETFLSKSKPTKKKTIKRKPLFVKFITYIGGNNFISAVCLYNEASVWALASTGIGGGGK